MYQGSDTFYYKCLEINTVHIRLVLFVVSSQIN